jgi:hypothetical protein
MVAADGTSTTTLTVTVHDANGNAVAGTAVTLSASGSSNTFGAISGTTDAHGVFTTTLASTLVQNETITATEGSVQEQTTVSFVAGAAATTSSIVASSPTVTADGVSTTTLTVTVDDALGHAVAGTAVTLSGSGSANSFGAISGITDANGHFTTTLASTLAQTETITATEGSIHEATPVTFVAGAPSATTSSIVASSPTVTADGHSTTTLTVTVEDAHGNAVGGTAVTLSGSGSDNTFGAISGTTNASGVFTTTLSSTLIQSETITAAEGSVQVTTAVSFVPNETVIESFGSTALVEVSNGFFLNAITGSNNASAASGPELKYGGAAVAAGEFGGWTPIGVEQTAAGYDVAWKITGTDIYSVWSTDNNGNFITNNVSNVNGAVSGASTALEAIETTFHQDLNGDGVIGIASTPIVIQTDGTTSLTQVGTNYYLYANGSGPTIKYGGADVTAGEFGGWTPIGAVQVANGYEVAWKVTGADAYSVWSTDNNGNFISNTVSNIVGAVSAASTALQSIETTFHQDLNSDGVIGVPVAAASPVATKDLSSNPGTNATADMITVAGNENFVFERSFAQAIGTNFTSATDNIQSKHEDFATINALAVTRNDAHANAVINDASHDTLTTHDATMSQLHAYPSDFHIV